MRSRSTRKQTYNRSSAQVSKKSPRPSDKSKTKKSLRSPRPSDKKVHNLEIKKALRSLRSSRKVVVNPSFRSPRKNKKTHSLYLDGGDYKIGFYSSKLLPYMSYNENTLFGIYSFLMSVDGISKEEITKDASHFEHTIVKVVQGPAKVEIYFLDNDNTLKLSIWNKNSNTDMNTRLTSQLSKIREARKMEYIRTSDDIVSRKNEYMRKADDAVKFRNKTTNESAFTVKDDYLKSVFDDNKEIEVLEEGKFIKLTRATIREKLAKSIDTLTEKLDKTTDKDERKKIFDKLQQAQKKQDAMSDNRKKLEEEQKRNLEEKSNFKKLDDDPLIGDESSYTKISATITKVEITDKLDLDIIDKLKSVAKTKINTIIKSTLDRYTNYVDHYTMLSELLPTLQKKLANLPSGQSLDKRDQALLTFLEKRLPELLQRLKSGVAPDYMKTWEAAIMETETTFYEIGKLKPEPEEVRTEELKPKTRLKDKPMDGGNKTYSEDLITNVLLSTAYILALKNSKSLNSSTPALVLNNENASIYYEMTEDKKQQLRVTLGTRDSTLLVDKAIVDKLKKDTEFLKKTRNAQGKIVIDKRNINEDDFKNKTLYSWNKSNYEEFEEHLWRTSRAMYIYTLTANARTIVTFTNIRNTMSVYGKRILAGFMFALLFSGLYADVQFAPKSALKPVGDALDIDISTYVPIFYQISCLDPVLNTIPLVESDYTKGLKLDCNHYFLISEIDVKDKQLAAKNEELAKIDATLAEVDDKRSMALNVEELDSVKAILLEEKIEKLKEEREAIVKDRSFTEIRRSELEGERLELLSKFLETSEALVEIRNPDFAPVYKANMKKYKDDAKKDKVQLKEVTEDRDKYKAETLELIEKTENLTKQIVESKGNTDALNQELVDTKEQLNAKQEQVDSKEILIAKLTAEAERKERRIAFANRDPFQKIYSSVVEPVVEYVQATFYSIVKGKVANGERDLQIAEKNLKHAIDNGFSVIKPEMSVKIAKLNLALVYIKELETNPTVKIKDDLTKLVTTGLEYEPNAVDNLSTLKATVHKAFVNQNIEFDSTSVSEAGGCVIS